MSEKVVMSPLYVLITTTVLFSTGVYSSQPSRCNLATDGSSNEFRLDCRNRNLNAIPRNVYGKVVVDLDLSGNHFDKLKPVAFQGYVTIKKLNISMCGIQSIARSSFEGLHLLEELDMKNNPVIGSGLPEGLFNPLPQLQRLFVSGDVTNTSDMSHWGNLTNLSEIILTPGQDDSFQLLTTLPKLVKVYFAFCQFGSVLRPSMLQAFKNSTIKELAFIVCDIHSIENGTFNGLSSLEALNLAGNTKLKLDVIINALSTSHNVTVKTLILDRVGADNDLFIAGYHDRSGCRPAWKHITSLSVRGTNIVALTSKFQNCLPNLESIAFGFNTIAECGRSSVECVDIVFRTLMHLRYVDMSYFMLSDTPGLAVLSGHEKSLNWIKLNEDYFPSFEQYTSQTCSTETNQTLTERSGSPNCIWAPFPLCLTYLKADHWFRNLFIPNIHRRCVQFSNNSLTYLNISSRFSAASLPLSLNRTVYGLNSLRVIDASRFGLIFIDFDTFLDMPSLEVLHLEGNILGRKRLPCFPRVARLTELNLASNHFRQFPARMFINLIALRHLDISNNKLTSVRFRLPTNLEYLDLSGNMLASFESDTQAIMNGQARLLLQLDHNPFQCDCGESDFVVWYQKTPVNISHRASITCQQGVRTYHITEMNPELLRLKCGLTVNTVVLSSVISGVIVFLLTVAFFLYRYRWVIRWRFYKLRYLRDRRSENMLLRDLNAELQHSAYVIYPYEDDGIRNWVFNSLVPEVERTLDKPPMFVVGRDDLGGQPVLDEIVRGIMRSQTAIWIICPAFFNDHYCETAAHFAFHQLGAQNNLLLILENRFEKYSIPKKFASLMHPNVGLSRVVYTDSEAASSLFWATIDRFIPVWSPIYAN